MDTKPTEILSDEHRVIEQVLDCLERMADECRRHGALDAQAAKDAIDFFRNFADRCHHGKEEAHLFPALEARGFSRDEGPTGVMRREHDQGRACVRGMDEAVDAASAGDAAAQRRFVEHATHYIDLLREHIQKEDHCLFAMANQVFSDRDQRELLSAFSRVEADDMGAGTHERFLALADRLAERFGAVRPRATPGRRPHACGHHG
jgi:hemerythrin-like domain-containing protein